MRLDSVRGLKQQLLGTLERIFGRATNLSVGARPVDSLPELHRSVALGVAPHQGEYRLAVRVQRPSLIESPLLRQLTSQAKGEVDVRLVGRIDKRAKTRRRRQAVTKPAAVPWYQNDTRPLLIGASVGHVEVTAGTIGAFVTRGGLTYLLSNNHVLANEDRASAADWILQRAAYDGGRQPAQRVARLRYWVKLKPGGINFVDCAIAEVEKRVPCDTTRLRGLANGDRALAGVGSTPIDEGESVFKIGRTTGATEGRVTAFDLDNVVVNYDSGNLRFDNQIEIEGAGARSFSDGGDSGSLILNSRMEAVALLFAGGDSGGRNGLGLTYANPLGPILAELKATLLF